MPDYFESGFSVRERMWHGQGLVVADHPRDWNHARELMGATWEPEERKVYVSTADGKSKHLVADVKAIVRPDTDEVLKVADDTYSLITFAEMGEILEAVLQEPNLKFETGGLLKGGRQVWALVMLDEPMQVPGDPSLILPYAALLNSFDGSAACRVNKTSVRVVCANTFAMSEAEGDRTGLQYVFRHTKNWRARVEQAREAITGLRQETARWLELATELSLMHVTPQQIERFTVEFIPMPPEGVVSDRVVENVQQARAMFRSCLESPTCEGINETGYGLVQASAEYLDHLRGYRNRETYLGRTLLRPEPLKTRAVQLVREVVAAG